MRSSMNIKAQQKGFTLIELVVVIVILGILAVTAAPKFIDLTSDAKASVVQAVEGSLKSASEMAHAKSLINGNPSASLSIAGATIDFINSYPTALTIGLLMDIDTTPSTGDFVLVSAATGTTITHGKAATPANCQAEYLQSTGTGLAPTISSDTTDC